MKLLDALRRHARERPQTVALREVGSGSVQTYRELQAAVESFASRLRTAGATYVIQIPNTLDFHAAFLGTLAAGCAAFPVPCDLTAPELRSAIARSGASGVVRPGLAVDPVATERVAAYSSPALLLQSSGTTGLPKIVHRPEHAIDAVALQMVEAIGIGADDQILSCVPLSHSYGLEHGLLAPVYVGATVHLADGFDIATVRRELSTSGITNFPAVPSVFEMLADVSGGEGSLGTLRLAYSAGGPLPRAVYERFFARFGVRVAQLYGATEFGSVTFTRPDDPAFDPGTVGRPMPGVEVRIDDAGQLMVRGRSMLSGYLDAPSPLDAEGFFATGDLAGIDAHGNVRLTGRIKLLIDVGGRKVNPLEVEQVLSRHPQVADCAVVPVRQSDTVNRLKAVIVPKVGSNPPTSESLRAFAKAELSVYKVPRVFEFRDALPRSASGKVMRHLLEAP